MRIGKCTLVLLAVLSLLTLAGCGSGKDHVGGVAGESPDTAGSAELVVQPTEKVVIDVWECSNASLSEMSRTTFTPSPFKFDAKVEVTVSNQDENKETVLFESEHYDLMLTSNKGELSMGTWQKPNAKSPDEYTLLGHSLVKGATTFLTHDLDTRSVDSRIMCTKKSSSEEVDWTPKVEDVKFLCSGYLFEKKTRDRDSGDVTFSNHYDSTAVGITVDTLFTDILFATKDFRIVINRRNLSLFLKVQTREGNTIAGTSIDAEAKVFELSAQTKDVDASIKCERTL